MSPGAPFPVLALKNSILRKSPGSHVENPIERVSSTRGLTDHQLKGSSKAVKDIRRLDEEMSKTRSREVKKATESGKEMAWSDYTASHASTTRR